MHNASLPTIRQLPNHELYQLKLVHNARPSLLVAVLTQKAIDLGVRFDNDRKDFQFNLSQFLGNDNGNWAGGTHFDTVAHNIHLDLSDRNNRCLVADLTDMRGLDNVGRKYNLDENLGLVDYIHPRYRETYFRLGVKPRSSPRKTLVLCFDGTTNHFSDQNTNVVKFVELLKKDSPEQQMIYYQTGVGTYTSPAWSSPISQSAAKVADMGVAWYLYQHVIDGYKFLMETYQAGDHIYIFGFSRGAFTARALAGMLHCVGLLPRHNIEHAPFAYEIYSSRRHDKETNSKSPATTSDKPVETSDEALEDEPAPDTASGDKEIEDDIIGSNVALAADGLSVATPPNYRLAKTPRKKNYGALGIAGNATARLTDPEAYKQTFGTPVIIDFVGGYGSERVLKSTDLSYIDFNPSIRIFRQALALDERRANFIPSLWDHSRTVAGQSVREVWFRGEHTDIGGGAPPPKIDETDPKFTALSNITLRWMVQQCLENKTTIMFDYESMQLYREESVLEYRLPRSYMNRYKAAFQKAQHLSESDRAAALADAVQQASKFLQLPADQSYKSSCDLDKIDVQHPPYETMGVLSPWWIPDFFPYNRHAKGWLETFTPNLGAGRSIQLHKPDDPIFIHASVVDFFQTKKAKGYVPRATWYGFQQDVLPKIDSLEGGDKVWPKNEEVVAAMKMDWKPPTGVITTVKNGLSSAASTLMSFVF